MNRVGSDFVGGGIPSGVGRLYRFGVIDESAIRQRFEALAPVLDERGRRRFAAAEATSAGHGGIIAVMRATGIARSTIGRGLAELRAGETPDLERVRRVGGGRRPLSETDANLLDDLRALVEPETRGDVRTKVCPGQERHFGGRVDPFGQPKCQPALLDSTALEPPSDRAR